VTGPGRDYIRYQAIFHCLEAATANLVKIIEEAGVRI